MTKPRFILILGFCLHIFNFSTGYMMIIGLISFSVSGHVLGDFVFAEK